jgi:DNA-binding transcriptional LysR family regulator
MDLRGLRAFVAVAEELHFGRAAERLSIAQPALSQQIMRLEESLSSRLFERSRNRVVLTNAGRALLSDARRILDLTEEAISHVRFADGGLAGDLHVGFVGALHLLLSKVIGEVESQLPNVRVRMSEMTFDQLLSGLYDERLDVGLFRNWSQSPSIVVEEIGRSRLVAALHVSHPAAQSPTVDLEDLSYEPFIYFSRTIVPGYADRINGVFGEIGIVPRVVQEVFTAQAAISFVAVNRGITIVPEAGLTSILQNADVVYRPIVNPEIEIPTVAAWKRRSESTVRTRVLEILRKGAA